MRSSRKESEQTAASAIVETYRPPMIRTKSKHFAGDGKVDRSGDDIDSLNERGKSLIKFTTSRFSEGPATERDALVSGYCRLYRTLGHQMQLNENS